MGQRCVQQHAIAGWAFVDARRAAGQQGRRSYRDLVSAGSDDHESVTCHPLMLLPGLSAAAHRFGPPLCHLVRREIFDVAGHAPPVSERVLELARPIAVELILHGLERRSAGLDR